MIFRKSELEKVLHSWAEQGGELDGAIIADVGRAVRSVAEAKAVCHALDAFRARFDGRHDGVISPLFTFAAFFQNVESEDAYRFFAGEGLPRLRLWVEDLIDGRQVDEDAVMFILKILAMYRQSQDVALIARVVRMSQYADSYNWSIIFSEFGPDHPFAGDMIDALRDPLPEGFALVAYLDMANALALAGKLDRHPFDSGPGSERLEAFLRDEDEENYGNAISATAALPFIESSQRGRLLQAAYDHRDPLVRIEAAWAQAKTGDPEGSARLSRFCMDPRYSHRACQYLEELGFAEEIPLEASEPEFQAVAEMANWLAYPSEFGRPPDAIELFDTREFYWPPTNDTRRLFLVKYAFDDVDGEAQTGIGLVGSVTFALFGEATADRSAEDIYGLHCCWELEMNGDPRAPEDRTAENGRQILARYDPGFGT